MRAAPLFEPDPFGAGLGAKFGRNMAENGRNLNYNLCIRSHLYKTDSYDLRMVRLGKATPGQRIGFDDSGGFGSDPTPRHSGGLSEENDRQRLDSLGLRTGN